MNDMVKLCGGLRIFRTTYKMFVVCTVSNHVIGFISLNYLHLDNATVMFSKLKNLDNYKSFSAKFILSSVEMYCDFFKQKTYFIYFYVWFWS